MRHLCGLIVFLLIGGAAFAPAQKPAPKKANARPPAAPAKPAEPFEKATVEEMQRQCVRFETEKGPIEMELFPESAPETVRNFLNLTAYGAFDLTTFHRVVPNFVIQGGDAATRKDVKPALLKRSYRAIPDEPNKILHQRGILSMARTDEPNTASSQFFILVRDAAFLDGKFAAFGRVTSGMEAVDAINKMPVTEEKPEKPVTITKASIYQCPAASGQ